MGKGKNAGYQLFLLLPHCFRKPAHRLVKSQICAGKGLTDEGQVKMDRVVNLSVA